ncbi:MAG: autotransporter outer membrane beta-barrel domain-containing protein [Alphaproteobacteria bacterium]
MSINGGNSYIKSGGEAVSSIISLGTEYVEGKSENARIYIGGSQIVENGGIASGSTVNLFGVQQVADGGQAAESRIIGGTQIVRGTADGTELFAGLQNIETGGLASDTKIHGGIQTVFSGGISRNTEADGGLIVLHSGGIMSGITKITDGILNVAGTNNISDLELKNALVTIIKEPGFSQLQIDKLDGSGIFSISSNLAQNEADHLDIRGGNGNFGLIVHDYSADGNLPAEFKLIDETSSAADNFYLVGNAVDVGAFRYNLQHDGDDWVLHRTQEHTDSSLIAKNTYSSLASLFYTHLNPLYNRFRMKHKRTGKDDGLWIKGIGREIKFRYKDQTKSNMKIYGAEIGYDREIWHNGGKGLQLGLYGGTSDSRQKYDRGGHGDGETQSLGVYSTLSTADNWFVDVVGTYFWHTQKIKSYTPSGSDVNGKYDANAWQVSAFVGKRWDIAESWFVEPYMGLNYMRVDGIDYRTNFNTRVSASAADYLGGSIGVSGGKEFVLADGTVFDAYGRFSLMHDWDGKSPVTVADEIFAEDTSSLRYELGAGIAAAWNETNSAYFEASTQLGSSVRFPWEINIGIQFNF